MNKVRNMFTPLKSLYFTQFLSSFADNLNFFIIVGIVKHQGFSSPDEYITNIQIGFLLAYVVLAPLVGTYADKNAKSHVLFVGNLLKSIGIGLLFFGVHPVLCYAILGIGAVIYSPAKYGILTELTDSEDQLLRANAMIEGSAILAIAFGTVAGGFLAEISDQAGIIACTICYIISLAFTGLIPRNAGNQAVRYLSSTRYFFRDMLRLLQLPKARFSLLGTGAFWLTTAVLRIALIAWIPANLGIEDTGKQSMILGTVAIGVILASVFTAKLVPAGKLYKAYYFGFLMVITVVTAALIPHVTFTVTLLLLMGFFGGVFLIPLNTMLQEVGKEVVGSGKTIAIQNFVENSLTVSGLLIYMGLNYLKMPINGSILIIGSIMLLFVLILSVQVPRVRQ